MLSCPGARSVLANLLRAIIVHTALAAAADADSGAAHAGAAFRGIGSRFAVRQTRPAARLAGTVQPETDAAGYSESRAVGQRGAGCRAGAGTAQSCGGAVGAGATLGGGAGGSAIRYARTTVALLAEVPRTAPGFTVRDTGDPPFAHAVVRVVFVSATSPHADDEADPAA